MTDQEKRGNVIKALELCTSKIEIRTQIPCETCPYHNRKYHGVLGDGSCNMRSLQRDMLALLKAQEPRKPEMIMYTGAGIGISNCPQCGCKIDEYHNYKFCGSCGQAVKWG